MSFPPVRSLGLVTAPRRPRIFAKQSSALRWALWACLLAAISAPATARSTEGSAPAPIFADFKVLVDSTIAPRVDLSTHPLAKRFRSRLREAAAKGPNFAGHCAVVSWGCGTNCVQWALIDLKTGRVYFHDAYSTIACLGHGEVAEEYLSFRRDSALLVLHGATAGDNSERRRYLQWRIDRFRLLLDVPIHPEEQKLQ